MHRHGVGQHHNGTIWSGTGSLCVHERGRGKLKTKGEGVAMAAVLGSGVTPAGIAVGVGSQSTAVCWRTHPCA